MRSDIWLPDFSDESVQDYLDGLMVKNDNLHREILQSMLETYRFRTKEYGIDVDIEPEVTSILEKIERQYASDDEPEPNVQAILKEIQEKPRDDEDVTYEVLANIVTPEEIQYEINFRNRDDVFREKVERQITPTEIEKKREATETMLREKDPVMKLREKVEKNG